MNKLERMTLVAVTMFKRYCDSNPDVGMGPSHATMLEDVMNMAGIHGADINYQKVLMEFKRRETR